jgi:hypothetical protein
MKVILLMFGLTFFLSCTKEVEIAIPQLAPQLVLHGQI